MLTRRAAIVHGAALTASFLAPAARAQSPNHSWPDRPVRVVVPFGPGGAIDILIRVLAPHFPPLGNG